MKVPPKRKGNYGRCLGWSRSSRALNESPSEKEGKFELFAGARVICQPSMKVPPKRKGNFMLILTGAAGVWSPSMKVPPKRKGNRV